MNIKRTPDGKFVVVDQVGKPLSQPVQTLPEAMKLMLQMNGRPPGQPDTGQPDPRLPKMMPQGPPQGPPTSLAQVRPPQEPPPQPMPPGAPGGPVMLPGAEPPRPPASLASYRPDPATAARLAEMTKGAVGPSMPGVRIHPDGRQEPMVPPMHPADFEGGYTPQQNLENNPPVDVNPWPTEETPPGQPDIYSAGAGTPESQIRQILGPERMQQVRDFLLSRMKGRPGAGLRLDQMGAQPGNRTGNSDFIPLKEYLLEKQANATVPSIEMPGRPSLQSDEVPKSLGQAYTQLAQAKSPVDQMLEQAEKGKPVERPRYFRNPLGGSKKEEPVAPKEKPSHELTDEEYIQRILKEQSKGKSSKKGKDKEVAEA